MHGWRKASLTGWLSRSSLIVLPIAMWPFEPHSGVPFSLSEPKLPSHLMPLSLRQSLNQVPRTQVTCSSPAQRESLPYPPQTAVQLASADQHPQITTFPAARPRDPGVISVVYINETKTQRVEMSPLTVTTLPFNRFVFVGILGGLHCVQFRE